MLGSRPREFTAAFTPAVSLPAERFYSVDVLGRTLWGWERRGDDGVLLARSEKLFTDYLSCFCDAHGRIP